MLSGTLIIVPLPLLALSAELLPCCLAEPVAASGEPQPAAAARPAGRLRPQPPEAAQEVRLSLHFEPGHQVLRVVCEEVPREKPIRAENEEEQPAEKNITVEDGPCGRCLWQCLVCRAAGGVSHT